MLFVFPGESGFRTTSFCLLKKKDSYQHIIKCTGKESFPLFRSNNNYEIQNSPWNKSTYCIVFWNVVFSWEVFITMTKLLIQIRHILKSFKKNLIWTDLDNAYAPCFSLSDYCVLIAPRFLPMDRLFYLCVRVNLWHRFIDSYTL